MATQPEQPTGGRGDGGRTVIGCTCGIEPYCALHEADYKRQDALYERHAAIWDDFEEWICDLRRKVNSQEQQLQAAERRADEAEADTAAYSKEQHVTRMQLVAAKQALQEIAKEAEVRKHSPHMNDEPLHTVISQKARAALAELDTE